MSYQLIKLIHIISATLMIGTGLGSAFYLYFIYKRKSIVALKEVLPLVIKADLLFTTPSVIIQLITGYYLSVILGLTWTNWFYITLSVSFIILILWIRAAAIQYKLLRILNEYNQTTNEFHRLMNIWFYLGIPSFLGSIFIYYLMVYKPFL